MALSIDQRNVVIDLIGDVFNDPDFPYVPQERLDLLDEAREVLKAEDQKERIDAQPAHERHVNLMAHCYLCRLEAGDQTDRLTSDDEEND